MTTGRKAWQNKYGADFLRHIAEEADWRAVEALWRLGSTTDLPALAKIMAESGDGTLAMLLGVEVTSGRYADHLPTLPDLLHVARPRVSADTARKVLDRLSDADKPLAAAYAAQAHLLVAWLMHQPGAELDDLAVEIAVGGHVYSDTAEPLDAALSRIARSGDLGARLMQVLAAGPDRSTTGNGWARTARVVGLAGANPKGRADVVRTLTRDLLALPPTEAVPATPEFQILLERHAVKEVRDAFNGAELATTPGTAAVVHAVASFAPAARDDLVESLAARQPTLWAAFRSELTGSWSVDDWARILQCWASPGSVLLEPGTVLAAAPAETAGLKIRVAVVHGTTPGDEAATIASAALRSMATDADGAAADVAGVVDAVPWNLITSDEDLQYVSWLLEHGLTAEARCETVMKAYDAGHVSDEYAVALEPDAQCVAAFGHLQPGSKRARFAAALYDLGEPDLVGPVFREVIDADNNTFDVIEAIAPRNCKLAFESFDEERWHNLDASQKDRLLELLESHATLEQAELLDTIALDSDGPNAGRRARSAKRWAALTPQHAMIPTGILSLLESARPKLNEVFAEVAAQVQPRDEGTLVSLQDKWLSGGKTGAAARAALDTVAGGVVTTLAQLRPPERRGRCPDLLHLLGITAAASSFQTLVSYVGADAVDDNAALRRAAAAAIRAFVDVTGLNGDQLDALGVRVSSETDPTASEDLRNALAAANLGDDAAILGLYSLIDVDPAAVAAAPDELFGSQNVRLLLSLKKMRVQKALGEPGWDGYVEQMDLVGEALARAAYLRSGGSAPLKKQIASNKHNEPDYGTLVKALGSTEGFGPTSANLQTIHNVRTTQTAAHHPSGGALDAETVGQCENALRVAARTVLDRLMQDQPVLRAVPAPGEEVS